MRRFTAVILAAGITLLASPGLSSVVTRVFVSVNGNDSNVCANVATPCRTFGGAIAQVDAGGDVIVLDTGSYGGTTITKSVTIDVPPGVVAFTGQPIVVNAPGAAVVLRGLTVYNVFLAGIDAQAADTVYVENCVIQGVFGSGIAIEGSVVNAFIKDSTFRKNSAVGVGVLGGRVSIDHCRFEGNGLDGLHVGRGIVTVRDSVAANNGGNGFSAEANGTGTQSNLNVYNCIATNNGTDGINASKFGNGICIVRVGNSSISENFGIGLNDTGGTFFETQGNNFVRGNIGGPTAGTITFVGSQ
jgi:hypothetical protein